MCLVWPRGDGILILQYDDFPLEPVAETFEIYDKSTEGRLQTTKISERVFSPPWLEKTLTFSVPKWLKLYLDTENSGSLSEKESNL